MAEYPLKKQSELEKEAAEKMGKTRHQKKQRKLWKPFTTNTFCLLLICLGNSPNLFFAMEGSSFLKKKSELSELESTKKIRSVPLN